MSFNENLTSLAYLVAAVLFIMALRGLSSPETSRQGNMMGMLGMLIAMLTTALSPEITSYTWMLGALVLGAVIGISIAKKIAMTAMPQLIAGFHSLVGMAAVLVAAAAYTNPAAFHLLKLQMMQRLKQKLHLLKRCKQKRQKKTFLIHCKQRQLKTLRLCRLRKKLNFKN